MLCCLLAALGLAGAWTALRLRLAGALILLIAGGGMAGYLLWDHIGHAGRYLAQGPATAPAPSRSAPAAAPPPSATIRSTDLPFTGETS